MVPLIAAISAFVSGAKNVACLVLKYFGMVFMFHYFLLGVLLN